jgi:hypothetical protein
MLGVPPEPCIENVVIYKKNPHPKPQGSNPSPGALLEEINNCF